MDLTTERPRPRRTSGPTACRKPPHLPERVNGVRYELGLMLVGGEWALTWLRCDDTPPQRRRCGKH